MLISVLIPVYNVAPYMKRCLESVFQQSYSGEMEVLLIDDCGTDNSIAIAESVIAENKRNNITVRILHHEHNKGLAGARNTAIEAAKGDFVMHVDSDDWIEKDAVEKLVEKQVETGADIVSGQAVAHTNGEDEILEDPQYSSKDDLICQMLIKFKPYHVLWRRLIRTSLYQDNHIRAIEGLNNGEDYYVVPQLYYFAKSVATVDGVVYNYNKDNQNSYTNHSNYQKYIALVESWLSVIAKLKEFFTDKNKIFEECLQAEEAKLLANYMTESFENKDKKTYKRISDWLFSNDKDVLAKIHMGSGVTRIFYRYYSLRCLKDKISRCKS